MLINLYITENGLKKTYDRTTQKIRISTKEKQSRNDRNLLQKTKKE